MKQQPIRKVPKSKAQLVAEMKLKQDVAKKRKFVKDEFYPALLKASESIEDAKILLSGFANMVMETFLAEMRDKKFAELKLEDKLDPKGSKYEEYKALLALFAGENVFTARELIEGMRNEIQMFVDTELKDRPLDTLKTNFYE